MRMAYLAEDLAEDEHGVRGYIFRAVYDPADAEQSLKCVPLRSYSYEYEASTGLNFCTPGQIP